MALSGRNRVVRGCPDPDDHARPRATRPARDPPPNPPAPAGPASTPASQLGSRWVIPGLAAVAASTLAALGMWPLYRRQHPTSLSR
jgi:hypothetical protein